VPKSSLFLPEVRTACCAEHVRIIHAIGGHLTSSIAFLRFKLAQEIGGTFVHKRLRNCKDKVGDLGEYLRMKKFDVRMNCVIPLEIWWSGAHNPGLFAL
jgi:hypothetical protein|tara:strand:+ start:63 stop:359 length:297 start_codon:yes stop_codon:yes gene_type:complete